MLVGHERVWKFLTQSVKNNRLAHAYIFVGPPAIGKKTLAIEFFKWLFCIQKNNRKDINQSCGECLNCQLIKKNQHPDIFILKPRQEEKSGQIKTFEIKIEQIRELRHQLSLSPYSADHKIALIEKADWLTNEAGGAFLKTLEEPSRKSLIILTTSAPELLLATLTSRCQLIKFLPVPVAQMLEGLKEVFPSEKRLVEIVSLAGGRPGQAIKWLSEPGLDENRQKNLEIFQRVIKADLSQRFEAAEKFSRDTGQAIETLEQWLAWLRISFLKETEAGESMAKYNPKTKYSRQQAVSLIRDIQATQNILSNPSFNAKLALENLMLKA